MYKVFASNLSNKHKVKGYITYKNNLTKLKKTKKDLKTVKKFSINLEDQQLYYKQTKNNRL